MVVVVMVVVAVLLLLRGCIFVAIEGMVMMLLLFSYRYFKSRHQ